MGRLAQLVLGCSVLLLLAAPRPGQALTCAPDEEEISGTCVKRASPSRPAELRPRFEHEYRPPPIGNAIRETGGSIGHLLPFDAGGAASHTTGTLTDVGHLVPVRAYLRSADIPPPSIGAYGVVAFRARPTPATRSRLLMACTSFVASIPPQALIPSSVAVSDQMLTIWPLDNPAAAEAVRDDCNFAIDHYDLFGGDSAIADAEKQGATFGEDGPFLIGWSPSNTRGVPDKLVLVVDMSRYNSQDSFDHAFLFWKQKIVEDPALWRSGFSVEGIRLAVRDFADGYGDTILKAAVSLWKK
ncbi:exported hypothetical protein [Bradyrhizobium sp. STM 3843]|uniref:hypothetical protein n=1 Tax=Bradyrhizobium sp. STM 3843 TaxID=551947 RepID=UPI0002407C8A|nr:hypothetical protein [Bradyrhizobium sp. STM 3843]CCE04909.1 exported hypothetical protein [Bradyrhizobium sp. STM 3843]